MLISGALQVVPCGGFLRSAPTPCAARCPKKVASISGRSTSCASHPLGYGSDGSVWFSCSTRRCATPQMLHPSMWLWES